MATTEHRVIGRSIGRSDGPEKTTGRAKYSIDMMLPGTLWCKVLRSPYAHARIVSIDTSEALKLPGVHAVVTGEDFKGKYWGKAIEDEPILCWDRVRYIGDKVAAVAADDEDIAQQALDLITVEYEELPAVFRIEDAMQPDAPIVHPEWSSYKGATPREKPGNVVVNSHWEKGNVHEGFAQADLVIEREFRTGRTHQIYLEPHNCLVWIDDEGVVQVWLGTKSPVGNRNQIASIIGLPPDKVNINFAYVGGDFGGKGDILGAPICYALAAKAGRPVKMALDYSEELMAANPRHECVITVKAGVKRDGTITAWESDLYYNGGAYRAYTPGGNLPGSNEVAGPYVIPHARVDAWVVATNALPGGFQRGPGEVQGIFAGESMMDIVAEELGMDPVAFRLKNVVHEGDELPTGGHRYVGIVAEEVIREAVRVSGWSDPRPPLVGRGIAYGHRAQVGGGVQISVSVDPDGSVLARTSTFEPGTGVYTLLQQTVAEEMEIPTDRIRVRPFSTNELTPDIFDFGFGGSRGSIITTQGAIHASAELKEELRRYAAESYGWDESIVSYEQGNLVNMRTNERVAMEEVARRRGMAISGRNRTPEERNSPTTSFVAQVAEVEVDPETGQVTLRRITAVHDVGKVLNPVGFNGQVEGGVVQSIGGTLMEEIIVDDGRVTNPSLGDYKVPTERDIPEIRIAYVEAPQGWGEYKVKAVGEHSNIITAPAITNAIYDAVGVRLYEIPVRPERLYRMIQGKQRSK